ncbi:MAG TPA: phytanoyl-CoA dioxygenase family protein [Candidatus Obscuribacterales bacterium]
MNTKQIEQMPSFGTSPEAALTSYLQLGYHVEPNVWTPDECDRLQSASKNLPSFKDGTFAPAMQAHRIEPTFLWALRNPTILKIIEQLVSGRVSAIQSEFFFCQPGTPGFTMHQDNYYVEAKRDAFASAWSAMQDITPDMGGLIVYPGSHNEPILPVETLEQKQDRGQDPNANRQQVVLPDGYAAVALSVPKGAAVFLHGHIVHSSHKNRSTRFRNVLLTTYIRRGESFRPGRYAGRAEVDVY